MTVRQAIEKKGEQIGEQKGRLKGIQEEKIAVAKNMIKMKLDAVTIQKVTGLSKQELDNMSKK